MKERFVVGFAFTVLWAGALMPVGVVIVTSYQNFSRYARSGPATVSTLPVANEGSGDREAYYCPVCAKAFSLSDRELMGEVRS